MTVTHSAVTHFKNFEMLDPDAEEFRAGELRGGHELIVEATRSGKSR
jgi:hypothetical protein